MMKLDIPVMGTSSALGHLSSLGAQSVMLLCVARSVPVRVRLGAGGVRPLPPCVRERAQAECARLGARQLAALAAAGGQAGGARARAGVPGGARGPGHGGRGAAAAGGGGRGEGGDHAGQHGRRAAHAPAAPAARRPLAWPPASRPHARRLRTQVSPLASTTRSVLIVYLMHTYIYELRLSSTITSRANYKY